MLGNYSLTYYRTILVVVIVGMVMGDDESWYWNQSKVSL